MLNDVENYLVYFVYRDRQFDKEVRCTVLESRNEPIKLALDKVSAIVNEDFSNEKHSSNPSVLSDENYFEFMKTLYDISKILVGGSGRHKVLLIKSLRSVCPSLGLGYAKKYIEVFTACMFGLQ